MKRALALAALALLAAGRLEPASPVLEKPKGFVTDKAGVLPPPRLRALNEELASFERATSNQIVVYVDRRMPAGTTLEELANVTFRSWGIGQKDKSNGVLFLVFTDDRLMKIEVGYGLEGVITDARSRRITGEVVKPFFKKGDYAGGVEAGTRVLMATARGEGNVGTGRTVAERRIAPPQPLWQGLTVLVSTFATLIVGLFRRRVTNDGVASILAAASVAGSLASFAIAAIIGPSLFWWVGGGFVIAAFVVLLIGSAASGASSSTSDSTSDSTSSDSTSSSSSWSSDSSSSSSSSDSSSSSSDFSGGGGDSGGGGSSDSW